MKVHVDHTLFQRRKEAYISQRTDPTHFHTITVLLTCILLELRCVILNQQNKPATYA